MAQPGLERDVSLLQTIARTNRQTIFGGEWACAGIYGDVGGTGVVRVGRRFPPFLAIHGVVLDPVRRAARL